MQKVVSIFWGGLRNAFLKHLSKIVTTVGATIERERFDALERITGEFEVTFYGKNSDKGLSLQRILSGLKACGEKRVFSPSAAIHPLPE